MSTENNPTEAEVRGAIELFKSATTNMAVAAILYDDDLIRLAYVGE